MDRLQVNVRLTPELIDAIDQQRIALQPMLGRIPSRSEVIRDILEGGLGLGKKLPATRSSKPTKGGR